MAKSTRNHGATQEAAATNLRSFRTFLLMRQFAAREIGSRIAQARREAGGMTQEDLAAALNISGRSVQDYEAGITIPWKHFVRLEQIFGRSLEWFLHGSETPVPADADADAEFRQEMQVRLGRIEEAVHRLLDEPRVKETT